MVRIVIGVADAPGILAHAAAVAGGLAQMGHGVELWAPGARTGVPSVVRARVEVVDLPAPGPDAAAAIARRVLDVVTARPACIHHAEDPVAAAALLEVRLATGVPVVRTVHHMDAATSHSSDELQRASLQDVDARVCVSAAWADRLREELGVTARVIPNGIDVARIESCGLGRAEAGALFGWDERPAVLSTGGIARRKGSRILLEAFARSRARLGRGAVLVLAGDGGSDDAGYRAGWHDDAARLGLTVGGAGPGAADVVLLGAVAADRMPALYRAVDVLANPSIREGSGVLALEAAVGGVPAVVSDIAGHRDDLRADRDCLMVAPGNSQPLADALVRLMRDAPLRDRVVAEAATSARRRSWAAAAAAHEELYRDALAG